MIRISETSGICDNGRRRRRHHKRFRKKTARRLCSCRSFAEAVRLVKEKWGLSDEVKKSF